MNVNQLVRAIRVQGRSYWTIAKVVNDHSYELEFFRHYPRQVSAKVISSITVPRLLDNGHIICPRDVVREMRTDNDIQILYSKAWEVKEYAQNLVYNDPLHSFQLLPSYFYMLKRENLRIVTKLKIDDENKFENNCN